MICKGKYFLTGEDGVRRCTECGEPADTHPKLYDKSGGSHGERSIYPPESKRLTRTVKSHGSKR